MRPGSGGFYYYSAMDLHHYSVMRVISGTSDEFSVTQWEMELGTKDYIRVELQSRLKQGRTNALINLSPVTLEALHKLGNTNKTQ